MNSGRLDVTGVFTPGTVKALIECLLANGWNEYNIASVLTILIGVRFGTDLVWAWDNFLSEKEKWAILCDDHSFDPHDNHVIVDVGDQSDDFHPDDYYDGDDYYDDDDADW